MGIRITCPQCNRELNVKSFLAGKRGVCPDCKAKFEIPAGSSHNVVLQVEDEAAAGRPAEAFPSPQPVEPRPLPPGNISSMAAPVSASFPAAPVGMPAQMPADRLPMATPILPASPAPMFSAMPADPIAQAPHAAWYIATAGGQQQGPISGDVLRQWVAERRLAADSLVWRDGWPQWLPAESVLPGLAAVSAPYLPMTPAVVAPAAPVLYAPGDSVAQPEVFPSEPRRITRGRSYGRRSQSTRTAIMVILILAVLILAPLLGYVLVQQF